MGDIGRPQGWTTTGDKEWEAVRLGILLMLVAVVLSSWTFIAF